MQYPNRWKQTIALSACAFVLLSSAVVVRADSFGQAPERWLDAFCPTGQVCHVGDVNGDGKADVLAFVRSSAGGGAAGDVLVALSNGASFAPTNAPWQDFFCVGDEVCDVGDFNGDGKGDVIAFVRDPAPGAPPGRQGDVYVALSNGSQFGPSGNQWQEFFCIDNETCGVGDFNGDGKDDIVAFVQSTNPNGQEGDVYVALSDGTKFGPSGNQWQEFFCIGGRVCMTGDFDGDGKDDVISFVRNSDSTRAGDVYVALSTGSSFGVGTRWQDLFCLNDDVCSVGDFNGDGKDDVVSFARGAQAGEQPGNVYVALSNGSSFGPSTLWQGALCPNSREVCATGDANGDGRDDAVVFVRDGESGAGQNNVLVARSTTRDFLPPRLYVPIIQRP